MIIARTDARTTLGLDEALRRAEAYAKAGADILFVESPESIEEMRTIGRTFDRPLVANMVEGGRTPVLDRKTLEEIGYSIAIYPAFGFLAVGDALRNVYRHLKENGSSVGSNVPALQIQRVQRDDGFWRRLRVRQDLRALDAPASPRARLGRYKPECFPLGRRLFEQALPRTVRFA